MKLTKADFRCSFFDESCDIDQDVIDQCLRDQKLRELIEKWADATKNMMDKSYDSDPEAAWARHLQKLLEESKKN